MVEMWATTTGSTTVDDWAVQTVAMLAVQTADSSAELSDASMVGSTADERVAMWATTMASTTVDDLVVSWAVLLAEQMVDSLDDHLVAMTVVSKVGN